MGPNTKLILDEGVRIVSGRVPAVVRKELCAAVKEGVLGYFPKKGLLPECFFNPNLRDIAFSKRTSVAVSAAMRINSVCC